MRRLALGRCIIRTAYRLMLKHAFLPALFPLFFLCAACIEGEAPASSSFSQTNDPFAPCVDPLRCCDANALTCHGNPDSTVVCTCSHLWSCEKNQQKCRQAKPVPSPRTDWICNWTRQQYACFVTSDKPPNVSSEWSCNRNAWEPIWECTISPPNPVNLQRGTASWQCSVDNVGDSLLCYRIAPSQSLKVRRIAHLASMPTPIPQPKAKSPKTRFRALCRDGDCGIDVAIRPGQTIQVDIPITLSQHVYRQVDVVFLVDVSNSFSDDITTYKTVAYEILSALKERIEGIRFGLASFTDFPLQLFGYAEDHPFKLRHALTDDEDAVLSAIAGLNPGPRSGWDWPESQLEALYQLSTGEGLDLDGNRLFDDSGDILPQMVGWRPGALPVIVLATDARFHDSDVEKNYPGVGFQETIRALTSRGIVVVGLDSGDAGPDLERIVEATGGLSYALDSNSQGVVEAIFEALDGITSTTNVTLRVSGDDLGIVQDISPATCPDAHSGETCNFWLTLRGISPDHVGSPQSAMTLEARGNDVAVIQSIPAIISFDPDG